MKTNIELRQQALSLRKRGASITAIEARLGVARSTLSGWFKGIVLTPQQQAILTQNSVTGLAKARLASIEVKRKQKIQKLHQAEQAALESLSTVPNAPSSIELALAMLYWGEGAKTSTMSIGNSDANLLAFYINAVHLCYRVPKSKIRCQLHLRMDQSEDEMITYWAQALNLPRAAFRSTLYDKRTEGKPTHSYYKGVCQVYYGSIALQRRLFFVYTHYCRRVISMGARSSVG